MMSRLYILFFSFLLSSTSIVAQTTYTWVGSSVGDYQVSSNWSPIRTGPAANDILAFNATVPHTIANVPNQTIGAIRIVSGTEAVTLTTNVVTNVLSVSAATPLQYNTAGSILAGDLLTISLTNTAAFTISAGTFGIAPSTGGKISIRNALTLAGGTLDFDVAGTGGTTIASPGSITYNTGIFVSNNTAAITWASGTNYYHAVSGAAASAIPASFWATGSTCNITGFSGGSVAPTGFTAATFANLTWNCPAQAGNIDLDFGGQTVNINGALNIVSTNNRAIRFSNSTSILVNTGTYTQTGGTIVLQLSSGTTLLNVNGNFSHTGGGVITFAGSGSTASSATLAVKGNLTKGIGSVWNSTSTNTASQMNIQFTGGAAQIVAISGVWTTPAKGRCNIINNNTDASGVLVNVGSLRVTNSESPSPATCTNSGNFTGTGAIVYSGTGVGVDNYTLIYNGTVGQTASSVEFPIANGPFNVTASSSVAVGFPASFSRTIPGRLSMVSGGISINAADTLYLTNASLATQLLYSGGFITSGNLSRRYPTSGLPTNAGSSDSRFPFGTGANDRSVNIFFSTSSLTGGAVGDIVMSHSAVVNAAAISPGFTDNGSLLDKRSNSFWKINTGSFDLGSGGTTISVTAKAENIGSVVDISTLRLTDNVAGFGGLIATTGTPASPVVGKNNLVLADINAKTFYIGSDALNALQIITFTWNGSAGTAWTDPANWTGSLGSGYPSAQTEIAIVNTVGGNMPIINTGSAISVYQLYVTAPASLTMLGTASISVYDLVDITGTVSFAGTSSFVYASSVATQNVLDLPYGNLGVLGAAAKILPAVTTVTGDLTISGAPPTFGTGTFVYAAGMASIQRVAAAVYYNLTFSGNRGGRTIRLGNGVSNNIIDVANVFNMAATNYTANLDAYNTFRFISTGPQTIPGFTYGSILSTGGGVRTYDPLGSADPAHIIRCKSMSPNFPYSAANNITTGSKIIMDRSTATSTQLSAFNFHDFELTGNLNNRTVTTLNGQLFTVSGTFAITATNYRFIPSSNTFEFNGTGAQTIPSFKTVAATNTAAWKFDKLTISNGNRVITLANTDTITVTGTLTVPPVASFGAGTGFNVAGSTVLLKDGSGSIPVLKPVVAGGDNYHNLLITGGTRILGGDIIAGGNVVVSGHDTSLATLNIGNTTSNRILTIKGNLTVTGSTATSGYTSVIDFNAGSMATAINLAGNLDINGTGLLTTTNGSMVSGTVLFNGVSQQYSNTGMYKNGFVHFTVGNGVAPTTLTLNNSLELIRSGVAPYSTAITVASNSILNAGTRNITVGTDDGNVGNDAAFALNATATLITANTGVAPNTAIEGLATDGTTGTILAGTKITKTYNAGANYVLNGATVQPFPAAISTMANLTIGAPVSLNKSITATATLNLASFTLTQAGNNLQFSGLASTTGNIYADNNSTLSITGTVGTVGALRFATGGNVSGEFSINRPVTVPLQSDLTIDNTALSGNFITGTASSILDINGNTLTINGAISGPGSLSGSNTSNLTLGGTAGTVSFTTGKQELKNFSLVNAAMATLGTALDITEGASAGNEGAVSVTGTAVLTTNGNLTIKSGAIGTARVAPGRASGGYINGDVTVERYLPAVRAWRVLAAPTVGQSIHQAWQENQPAGVDPGTGYGTIISSNGGSWAANGFDFYSPGNSLLSYNGTSWVGVANTSTAMAVAGGNKSYMLFSRGNRSVTPAMGTGATPTPIILRSKGALFQGDLAPVNVSAVNSFAAVGNNYASAIDFTLLSKPNIDQYFAIWDPKIPGAHGVGGWVTFSASTPTPWVPIPGGGSFAAGVPNTRIESGQAFMVHTTGGSASVTFNETSKLSGSSLALRPGGGNSLKSAITTNLYNMSTGEANIADGNVAVFALEYSNAMDGNDALKPTNVGDNFGLLRNGLSYVVDARQPVTETDTVFFSMKKIKQQPYRLEFILDNFDNNLMAFLEDTYLHTSTALTMQGTSTVDFTVSSETASAAVDRFRIVFKQINPLPVTFTTVTAVKNSNGNAVEWKVENEINISSYEVERSTDGVRFAKVGAVAVNSNSLYNWLDAYPVSGDNFYRIKSIDNRGATQYSRIVKVASVKGRTGYSVYPNPSTDGSLGLQMSNISAGIYTVKITNGNGQLVWRELINHPGGTATNVIHPSSQLVSGNYQLEVIDITGKSTVIKVMVL